MKPSKRPTILIVDPDVAGSALLVRMLSHCGFDPIQAGDVAEAMRAVQYSLPDAILLERVLPGTSAIEYLDRLKHDPGTCDIPIVLMGAGTTSDDRVVGLDLGADDFIDKSISEVECVARLQAVLRRRARQKRRRRDGDDENDSAPIEYAGLRLDPLTHRVSVGGDQFIPLAPSEFRLLRFFLRHPDRVHSRRDLQAILRGPGSTILSRTIDVYVRRVRQALKRHGCDALIQTVRSSGYRFSASGVSFQPRVNEGSDTHVMGQHYSVQAE